MKSPHFRARIALAAACSVLLGMSAVKAQTSLDFTPFEYEGVSNVSDLDHIDLNALILSTAEGVTVSIRNQSIIGDPGVTLTQPTVTKIFFDDRAGLTGGQVSILSQVGDVSFVRNDGANLPGGKKIDFNVDSAFTAAPPPSVKGVDPGEAIVFLFSSATYEQLVASVTSGDFRIGLHVQEIGRNGEDSAAFVSVIPEPGGVLPVLLGSLLLLRRRRRP